MRRQLAALGLALCLAHVQPTLVRACSPVHYEPLRPWTKSETADDIAPTTAPVITGSARAPKPTDDGCSRSKCGGTGGMGPVVIHIEESAVDESTPPEKMAYRIEVISGDSPFPAEAVYATKSADGELEISKLTDDETLDLRLRVIPVDAGGNEGPPSNVIRLHFDESGCAAAGSGGAGNLLPSALLALGLLCQARRRRLQSARTI